LVSREGISLQCLPSGARLGTSSLRRQAQILSLRPDLQAVAVRGNVDTRLRKLRSSNLDGLVLAAAGLERLGSLGQVTEFLTEELFLPAPGQGAMGIESRAAERDLFSFLGDETARTEVEAERAFLSRLQGGCRVPIGARARFSSRSRLHLKGVVLSVDGRQRMASEEEGDAREPQRIGSVLAERILALGGAALLEGIR
jgi:hydroxymethylbilane synthase